MVKKAVVVMTFVVACVAYWGSVNTQRPLNAETEWEVNEKSSEKDEVSSLVPQQEEQEQVQAEEPKEPVTISIYDPIFKVVCSEYENDWRLMSAIAYHESRFRPDATSKQGAQGMMQIMPHVAKFFGVERENLSDVETNIMVANLLVNRIDKMLKFPASTSQKDRMGLILASYNGGVGYVFSAQKLARNNGDDPFSWEVIAQNLRQMKSSEFAEANSVRHFRGVSQTLAYVDNVIGHYYHYCEIAAL